MGSPDGTRIALGLLASTSAVILAYVFVKKYGFRASKTKADKEECEKFLLLAKDEQSETGQSVPEKQKSETGLEPSVAVGNQMQNALPQDLSGGIDDSEEGQNQTSFIVIDGAGVVPTDGDKCTKKSDRSSDESSYDVIEGDRLDDSEEEEDDKAEADKSKDLDISTIMLGPVVNKPSGDDKPEEALETSMVMLDTEQALEGRSEPSFYTSADENFGMSHLEEEGIVEGETVDEKEEKGSDAEDEMTVMYKSGLGSEDSSAVGERDLTKEADSEGSVQEGQGEQSKEPVTGDAEGISWNRDDPAEQESMQTLALTEAVLEANLEAVTSTPDGATETGQQQEAKAHADLDFAQVTETLSKCQNNPMSVSNDDICLLVQLLRNNLPDLNAAVLDCLVRVAAFNQNTTSLRESGCPEEIIVQLKEACQLVRRGAPQAEETLSLVCQVLTNLSLDPKSHSKLENGIPSLVSLITLDAVVSSESLALTILRPLVNLSGENDYHHYYKEAVPGLYNLLDVGSHMTKVLSLKVLVNLSLDSAMLGDLLAAKAPTCLLLLLAAPTPNDAILRAVTLLANIFTEMEKSQSDLPQSSLETEHSVSMLGVLGDVKHLADLRDKVLRLTRDGDEDVRFQASRLYKFIPESAN